MLDTSWSARSGVRLSKLGDAAKRNQAYTQFKTRLAVTSLRSLSSAIWRAICSETGAPRGVVARAMASLLWNELAEADARLGASHSRRSDAHPDLVGNDFPTARDLLAIVRPTA